MRSKSITALLLLVLFSLCCHPARAAEAVTLWSSQQVYVPLYSDVRAGDRFRERPFQLAGTLFIRNTDPQTAMIVTSVDYYNTEGKKLRSILQKPLSVGPLATFSHTISENDTEGGAGAKFLISWESPVPLHEPIIESIMIGTAMQQGISFLAQSRIIAGAKAPVSP